jgi:uncharacterized membrane protein
MSEDAPRPGTEPPPRREEAAHDVVEDSCDLCGSADLWWRNCKLLCRSCQAIVKSCADL